MVDLDCSGTIFISCVPGRKLVLQGRSWQFVIPQTLTSFDQKTCPSLPYHFDGSVPGFEVFDGYFQLNCICLACKQTA